MMKHLRMAAMAMALSLLAVLCLTADDKPDAKAPVAKPKDDTALTVETLGAMMENMGWETIANKDKAGAVTGYYVRKEVATYTVSINYSFSPSKKWLYLTCYLSPLPDPKVPPKVAMAMLEANDRWGPASFAYYKTGNKFYAQLPVYNQGIKPALLNQATDILSKAIGATTKDWDPAKWDKEEDKKTETK